MRFCRKLEKCRQEVLACRLFAGELDGMPCRCMELTVRARAVPKVRAWLCSMPDMRALRREPCPEGQKITVYLPPERHGKGE